MVPAHFQHPVRIAGSAEGDGVGFTGAVAFAYGPFGDHVGGSTSQVAEPVAVGHSHSRCCLAHDSLFSSGMGSNDRGAVHIAHIDVVLFQAGLQRLGPVTFGKAGL